VAGSHDPPMDLPELIERQRRPCLPCILIGRDHFPLDRVQLGERLLAHVGHHYSPNRSSVRDRRRRSASRSRADRAGGCRRMQAAMPARTRARSGGRTCSRRRRPRSRQNRDQYGPCSNSLAHRQDFLPHRCRVALKLPGRATILRGDWHSSVIGLCLTLSGMSHHPRAPCSPTRKSPPPTNRQAGNASAVCPERLSDTIAA
jgi:hypothetical protein